MIKEKNYFIKGRKLAFYRLFNNSLSELRIPVKTGNWIGVGRRMKKIRNIKKGDFRCKQPLIVSGRFSCRLVDIKE
jgi:hypothetical protein